MLLPTTVNGFRSLFLALFLLRFCHILFYTAWKVSVFGVFLIRIFLCRKIRIRKSPNTYTFNAVKIKIWQERKGVFKNHTNECTFELNAERIRMRENTDQKNYEYGIFLRSVTYSYFDESESALFNLPLLLFIGLCLT